MKIILFVGIVLKLIYTISTQSGIDLYDTVKSEWSIVYIEGSQVIVSKNITYIFLSLTIDFVLANSAGPDEMLYFIRVFTLCQSTRFGPKRIMWILVVIVKLDGEGSDESAYLHSFTRALHDRRHNVMSRKFAESLLYS